MTKARVYSFFTIWLIAVNYLHAQPKDSTSQQKPIVTKMMAPFVFQPADKVSSIAPNFYTTQLGFFCRQELKVEKITHIPVLFRLGNVADCNYMEQKTHYKMPAQ